MRSRDSGNRWRAQSARRAWPPAARVAAARVIYYFQNDLRPIVVLTIYAKNERANLSAAERNALAKLVAELKKTRAMKGSQQ